MYKNIPTVLDKEKQVSLGLNLIFFWQCGVYTLDYSTL